MNPHVRSALKLAIGTMSDRELQGFARETEVTFRNSRNRYEIDAASDILDVVYAEQDRRKHQEGRGPS